MIFHYKRAVATATAALFLFSTFSSNPSYAAQQPSFSEVIPGSLNGIESLQVPAEFGEIQEVFPGKGKTVILIQDAHSIPDAQRSIQKLINHFQKSYGVRLVAMEGAASKADPQIFRSFPDREILEKTFDSYFEKGELAGGNAAAIFNEIPGDYRGVENWQLYGQALGLYLDAMGKSGPVLEKILNLETKLKNEKENAYSKSLLEIDETLESFHENNTGLVETIKILAQVEPPAKGSEMDLVLQESETGDSSRPGMEMEVKAFAAKVQKQLNGLTLQDWQKTFSEKNQAFQTSGISAQAFALYLKELIVEQKLNVPFPKSLLKTARDQRKIRDLEGTQFFKAFEVYSESVKAKLFRDDKERTLDRQGRQLRLLRNLARLEISREDWNEIKAFSGQRIADRRNRESESNFEDSLNAIRSTLSANFAFYENAQSRDQAFCENLIKLMENESSAMLIAGGFHSQGLAERLRAQGISYALVMPRINVIPDETHYRDHMRGDVSWKSYFEVERGRVNLYKAFVRATRDKLLDPASGSKDKKFLLKNWRNQIIRDLSQKGEIAKSGEYTVFLDETVQKKQSSKLQDSLARADAFLVGLRDLESKNQLTEQNILNLLKPSSAAIPVAEIGGLFPSDAPSQSELGLDLSRQIPTPVADLEPVASKSEVRNEKSIRDGHLPPNIDKAQVPALKWWQKIANKVLDLFDALIWNLSGIFSKRKKTMTVVLNSLPSHWKKAPALSEFYGFKEAPHSPFQVEGDVNRVFRAYLRSDGQKKNPYYIKIQEKENSYADTAESEPRLPREAIELLLGREIEVYSVIDQNPELKDYAPEFMGAGIVSPDNLPLDTKDRRFFLNGQLYSITRQLPGINVNDERTAGIRRTQNGFESLPLTPLQTTIDELRKIARAVDLFHKYKIYNRDLKPQEIYIAEDKARILDYDAAVIETPETPQLSLYRMKNNYRKSGRGNKLAGGADTLRERDVRSFIAIAFRYARNVKEENAREAILAVLSPMNDEIEQLAITESLPKYENLPLQEIIQIFENQVQGISLQTKPARSEVRTTILDNSEIRSLLNAEFDIDPEMKKLWAPQSVKQYTVDQYWEAMLKSSGLAVIHTVTNEEIYEELLQRGYLLASKAQDARGEESKGTFLRSYALHFSVNGNYFEPKGLHFGGKPSMAFLASPEALLEAGKTLSINDYFLSQKQSFSEWLEVAFSGFSSNYRGESHHFDPNDLGLLLVPEYDSKIIKTIEALPAAVKPRRIFFYKAYNLSDGIQEFFTALNEFGIKNGLDFPANAKPKVSGPLEVIWEDNSLVSTKGNEFVEGLGQHWGIKAERIEKDAPERVVEVKPQTALGRWEFADEVKRLAVEKGRSGNKTQDDLYAIVEDAFRETLERYPETRWWGQADKPALGDDLWLMGEWRNYVRLQLGWSPFAGRSETRMDQTSKSEVRTARMALPDEAKLFTQEVRSQGDWRFSIRTYVEWLQKKIEEGTFKEQSISPFSQQLIQYQKTVDTFFDREAGTRDGQGLLLPRDAFYGKTSYEMRRAIQALEGAIQEFERPNYQSAVTGFDLSALAQAKGYQQKLKQEINLRSDWKKPHPNYRAQKHKSGKDAAPRVLINDREGEARIVDGVDKNERYADPPDYYARPGVTFSSYVGEVARDKEGRPLNPVERTGLEERHDLGKWGRNLAGDPISSKIDNGKKKILMIQRKDGSWAIPGGMVDDDESVERLLSKMEALLKEQMEAEALKDLLSNIKEALEKQANDKTLIAAVRELMEETGTIVSPSAILAARPIYRGYVDDPRNTDNAWMETGAWHISIEKKDDVAAIVPYNVEESRAVQWKSIEEIQAIGLDNLYASHGKFLAEAFPELTARSERRANRVSGALLWGALAAGVLVSPYALPLSAQNPPQIVKDGALGRVEKKYPLFKFEFSENLRRDPAFQNQIIREIEKGFDEASAMYRKNVEEMFKDTFSKTFANPTHITFKIEIDERGIIYIGADHNRFERFSLPANKVQDIPKQIVLGFIQFSPEENKLWRRLDGTEAEEARLMWDLRLRHPIDFSNHEEYAKILAYVNGKSLKLKGDNLKHYLGIELLDNPDPMLQRFIEHKYTRGSVSEKDFSAEPSYDAFWIMAGLLGTLVLGIVLWVKRNNIPGENEAQDSSRSEVRQGGDLSEEALTEGIKGLLNAYTKSHNLEDDIDLMTLIDITAELQNPNEAFKAVTEIPSVGNDENLGKIAAFMLLNPKTWEEKLPSSHHKAFLVFVQENLDRLVQANDGLKAELSTVLNFPVSSRYQWENESRLEKSFVEGIKNKTEPITESEFNEVIRIIQSAKNEAAREALSLLSKMYGQMPERFNESLFRDILLFYLKGERSQSRSSALSVLMFIYQRAKSSPELRALFNAENLKYFRENNQFTPFPDSPDHQSEIVSFFIDLNPQIFDATQKKELLNQYFLRRGFAGSFEEEVLLGLPEIKKLIARYELEPLRYLFRMTGSPLWISMPSSPSALLAGIVEKIREASVDEALEKLWPLYQKILLTELLAHEMGLRPIGGKIYLTGDDQVDSWGASNLNVHANDHENSLVLPVAFSNKTLSSTVRALIDQESVQLDGKHLYYLSLAFEGKTDDRVKIPIFGEIAARPFTTDWRKFDLRLGALSSRVGPVTHGGGNIYSARNKELGIYDRTDLTTIFLSEKQDIPGMVESMRNMQILMTAFDAQMRRDRGEALDEIGLELAGKADHYEQELKSIVFKRKPVLFLLWMMTPWFFSAQSLIGKIISFFFKVINFVRFLGHYGLREEGFRWAIIGFLTRLEKAKADGGKLAQWARDVAERHGIEVTEIEDYLVAKAIEKMKMEGIPPSMLGQMLGIYLSGLSLNDEMQFDGIKIIFEDIASNFNPVFNKREAGAFIAGLVKTLPLNLTKDLEAYDINPNEWAHRVFTGKGNARSEMRIKSSALSQSEIGEGSKDGLSRQEFETLLSNHGFKIPERGESDADPDISVTLLPESDAVKQISIITSEKSASRRKLILDRAKSVGEKAKKAGYEVEVTEPDSRERRAGMGNYIVTIQLKPRSEARVTEDRTDTSSLLGNFFGKRLMEDVLAGRVDVNNGKLKQPTAATFSLKESIDALEGATKRASASLSGREHFETVGPRLIAQVKAGEQSVINAGVFANNAAQNDVSDAIQIAEIIERANRALNEAKDMQVMLGISARSEARQQGLFKENEMVQALITQIQNDWESIQKDGAFAFDIEKTLVGFMSPLPSEAIDLLAGLLKNNIRVAIITGMPEEPLTKFVVEPLKAALADDPARWSQLTLYSNGGATKSLIDTKGSLVRDHKYSDRHLIPDKFLPLIQQVLIEAAANNFGIDPARVAEISKKWRAWVNDPKRFPKLKLDDSWSTGNQNWRPEVIDADAFWNRSFTGSESITLPAIVTAGHTPDGYSIVNILHLPELPEDKIDVRLDIEEAILAAISAIDPNHEIRTYSGGVSAIDVIRMSTNKAEAMIDFIDTNHLNQEKVFYFGDQFYKIDKVGANGKTRELEGNDESVAAHPDLKKVTTLGVAEKDPENSKLTLHIGRGVPATFELLSAVLPRSEARSLKVMPTAPVNYFLEALFEKKVGDIEITPILGTDFGKITVPENAPIMQRFAKALREREKDLPSGFQSAEILTYRGEPIRLLGVFEGGKAVSLDLAPHLNLDPKKSIRDDLQSVWKTYQNQSSIQYEDIQYDSLKMRWQEFQGKHFPIFLDVFSPENPFTNSILDKDAVISVILERVKQNEIKNLPTRILILGSGAGPEAVVLSSELIQKFKNVHIDAVDIGSLEVANTKASLAANNLAGVNVFQSDGFNALKGKRYDFVVFDAPLPSDMPEDDADIRLRDANGALRKRILNELKDHLLPKGIFYMMADEDPVTAVQETQESLALESEEVYRHEWGINVYSIQVTPSVAGYNPMRSEARAQNIYATVETGFDAIAEEYAKKYGVKVSPEIEARMKQFVSRLPGAGLVLDAGTGPGRSAALFKALFNQAEDTREVYGIDLSQKMIDEARLLHPEVSFERMNFNHLSFKDGAVAGIWADASFHHVPSSDAETVLQEFRRVLNPDGGILFMTVKTGDTEGEEDDPRYPGVKRFFKRYQEEELKALVQKNGFKILNSKTQVSTMTGDGWIHLFAEASARAKSEVRMKKIRLDDVEAIKQQVQELVDYNASPRGPYRYREGSILAQEELKSVPDQMKAGLYWDAALQLRKAAKTNGLMPSLKNNLEKAAKWVEGLSIPSDFKTGILNFDEKERFTPKRRADIEALLMRNYGIGLDDILQVMQTATEEEIKAVPYLIIAHYRMLDRAKRNNVLIQWAKTELRIENSSNSIVENLLITSYLNGISVKRVPWYALLHHFGMISKSRSEVRASKPEAEKIKRQVEYHMHRLETAEYESLRLVAVDSLASLAAYFHIRLEEATSLLTDDQLRRILDVYKREPYAWVRARILSFLPIEGFHMSQVRQFYYKVLRDLNLESVSDDDYLNLLGLWQFAFRFTNEAESLSQSERQEFYDALSAILSKDELQPIWETAIRVIVQIIGEPNSPSDGNGDDLSGDLREQAITRFKELGLVERLKRIQSNSHLSMATRITADGVLISFGAKLKRDETLWKASQKARNEKLFKPSTELSAPDLLKLVMHIQREGNTPVKVLEQLLSEGTKFVFINSTSNIEQIFGQGLREDILDLKEKDYPVYVAFNLPAKLQGDFDKALGGKVSKKLERALSDYWGAIDVDHYEMLFNNMSVLKEAGIPILLTGANEGLEGELWYDSQVNNFAAIIKKNQRAKVFVIDMLVAQNGMVFSRKHLPAALEGESMVLSVPQALTEMLGPGKVVTMIEHPEGDLPTGDEMPPRVNNLGAILPRMPPISFSAPIAESPLAKVQMTRSEVNATFDIYDYFTVRRNNDGGGNRRSVEPPLEWEDAPAPKRGELVSARSEVRVEEIASRFAGFFALPGARGEEVKSEVRNLQGGLTQKIFTLDEFEKEFRDAIGNILDAGDEEIKSRGLSDGLTDRATAQAAIDKLIQNFMGAIDQLGIKDDLAIAFLQNQKDESFADAFKLMKGQMGFALLTKNMIRALGPELAQTPHAKINDNGTFRRTDLGVVANPDAVALVGNSETQAGALPEGTFSVRGQETEKFKNDPHFRTVAYVGNILAGLYTAALLKKADELKNEIKRDYISGMLLKNIFDNRGGVVRINEDGSIDFNYTVLESLVNEFKATFAVQAAA